MCCIRKVYNNQNHLIMPKASLQKKVHYNTHQQSFFYLRPAMYNILSLLYEKQFHADSGAMHRDLCIRCL